MKDPVYYSIMELGHILPDTVNEDALYLKLLYKNRMKKNI
mgnify:CR=1 FL=1